MLKRIEHLEFDELSKEQIRDMFNVLSEFVNILHNEIKNLKEK